MSASELQRAENPDKMDEPSWRRAAMPQSQRFEENVEFTFSHGIVIHATQSIDTGSCIWDAALVLASFFANRDQFPADFWPKKRVCEIGAGCGVTGLVVAQLGADVVLTELADELKLLQKNVAQNPINIDSQSDKSGISHLGSATAMEYFWGSDPSHLGDSFDIIVAADCVYEVQLFDMLAKAMVDICAKNTKAYFCVEHRWSDIEAWWWKEIKKNFQVRLVPQTDHGEYQHPKIDIYELRKKFMYSPHTPK
jgi:predicted nicotinamide N-methyase